MGGNILGLVKLNGKLKHGKWEVKLQGDLGPGLSAAKVAAFAGRIAAY